MYDDQAICNICASCSSTHTCSNWVYEQKCAKMLNVIAEACQSYLFLKLSVCW